jgi:hypothetical protein
MPDPHPLAPMAASPRPPAPALDARERHLLLCSARTSATGARLAAVLGPAALDGLAWPALAALARGEPVDPNAPASWAHPDAHAAAILARHGVELDPRALTMPALRALIDAQAAADRDAGLNWTTPEPPRPEDLAAAHARLGIDLGDPAIYLRDADRRVAVSRRLGLDPDRAAQLSAWALTHPERFEAGALGAWRIASPAWLELAEAQLGPVAAVRAAPVGLLLAPAPGEPGAWALTPALSIDVIRALAALGARIDDDLAGARLSADATGALLETLPVRALHAGPRELLDAPAQLAAALERELGTAAHPGPVSDPRERWGRLRVTRHAHTRRDGSRQAELALRVMTIGARRFPRRRVGAAPAEEPGVLASAAMEIGEAVQAAIERQLALALSSEAAGQLAGQVRAGRMKGRPGLLCLTTADGASATTRRLVAEQALGELRALRDAGTPVTLDAGARELIRMTLARPLADDPVLLGRQREIATLKVLGSGVDASQVGTGKTITTARALDHRAQRTPRLRALVIAEGRLLAQWHAELSAGAPERGLPALAPTLAVHTLDPRRPIAAQVRAFDQDLGERPGLLLAANGTLDRHPDALATIPWHLLVADEALRYANPHTDAHRALAALRAHAADCWLLTATPRGRSAEHLDVLVGLALGDGAMIRERLGTREAGDLLEETNAQRLRLGYGPHLVRVTRADLAAFIPALAPAVALPVAPDPALARLLEAIRRGGRHAYHRLLELLRELREAEPGRPLAKAALAELARVQGAVLSNVGVYLDASVDPATLTHSGAALAQALVRDGLVEPAAAGGGDGQPLLRGVSAQTIAAAAGEHQVLVFAERVRCLRALAATLRERHGIPAAVGDGATDPAAFAALKQRFAAGELRVLCLSRIGHEGHNLQSASVLVHLDLPWLPGGLEQRVGRAARPGSRHPQIDTYIPYLRGGAIEHVVSILSPRGGEHHQLLDAFDGLPAAQSTVATQLADITGQVAESKQDAGYAGTAARLRVAAAVFGAP